MIPQTLVVRSSYMKLDNIPISKIDFDDDTYLLGSRIDSPLLLNSIKEIGLINPPVLRDKNHVYQIISGYKRLKACKELGIEEVFSRVYKSGEISNEECLKIVFYENQEILSDMERAELLLKFKRLCGLEQNELTQRVLPFLGIVPSRKNFEKYKRLAELEREIKDAFYSQKISIEQVIILSEMPSPIRIEILNRVLLKSKMNTNETREVVREIIDITARDKRDVKEIIDEIEIKIGQRDVKTDLLRREVKLMRYPMLARVEEEFKGCLKSLNLPKDVTVHHPPFFEGNYIEFRMKIESAQRLSEILSYLASVLHNGLLNKLLGIVKEGKQSDRSF